MLTQWPHNRRVSRCLLGIELGGKKASWERMELPATTNLYKVP